MKKLYAVAINTIDKSYQLVQINHVVAVFASKNNNIDWNSQTFVCLESGEFKLMKLIDRLKQDGIEYHAFYEPDIGNKLTAIACLTDDYKRFKSFNLF